MSVQLFFLLESYSVTWFQKKKNRNVGKVPKFEDFTNKTEILSDP